MSNPEQLAVDLEDEAFAYPLSFAQQRMWFLDQWDRGNPVYNVPLAARLTGELKVSLLEQSLTAIIQRHESLRTTFPLSEGQPIQLISAILQLPLPVIDLQSLPDIVQEAQLAELSHQQAHHAFDLSQGPLLHFYLVRLQPQMHVLLLTMHHIISDGWSLGVLVRDLIAFYQAFSLGMPVSLPSLAVQYADYAVWQHQQLQGETLAALQSYWRQQLSDAPEALELPTDFPRPPVQSFQGATVFWSLPADLSAALAQASQREGVTLFMFLLAAFNVLLFRYSGQEDLLVGSPIANRTRPEIEGLIGFFVNTLVLRTNLAGNPSFREVLRRTREVTLAAYEHQELPFEQLVEMLQPRRELGRTPLFQVMFVLQNAPMPALQLPGLRLTPLEMATQTAKFDLTLSLTAEEQGIKGSMEYRTDLFAEETICQLLRHFQLLLESAVSDVEQPVSSLSFLSSQERRQLLLEWNETATEYPQLCIHQLFEEQAEKIPEAIALVCLEQHMTYAQLNQRANQLAHILRQAGVGPEVAVGVCLERSVEIVVALLAVLKAGGAYVPLDATLPAARLQFLLEDACVQILLTQKRIWTLASTDSVRIIDLEEEASAVSEYPQDNLANTMHPTNLAYHMYTSGSMGQPKGVSVTHRGVVRLVKETTYVTITKEDRFLQCAPLSFDASTFEIWGPLLNGAQLVILPPTLPSIEVLQQVLQRYHITILWLTAGLFHQIVDFSLDSLASVRQLLAGGEVLSVPHVCKAKEVHPLCTLINGYGPTEGTTFTCCFHVLSANRQAASIPIGCPIGGTQIYVLDANLCLVPVGVPGELYIGGAGLARGYLRRPELTAERFIPHPFSQVPGERLYRTGDRVRYLRDGNLEFLGRLDRQVKLRGYRIELGEIEVALKKHPLIRDCIVLCEEAGQIDKRLVAYLVTEGTFTVDDVRTFLRTQLPEYMLPASFLLLDALPLNSRGKVDRHALVLSSTSRLDPGENYVTPRTELEEVLASVWADVLEVSRVGMHDNFFELGGHSLLATHLVAQIQEIFQVELSLSDFFAMPTISGVVEALLRDPEDVRRVEEIAHLCMEVAQFSDNEVAQMLEEKKLHNETFS